VPKIEDLFNLCIIADHVSNNHFLFVFCQMKKREEAPIVLSSYNSTVYDFYVQMLIPFRFLVTALEVIENQQATGEEIRCTTLAICLSLRSQSAF
jgi:hypothetical protein